MIDPETGLVIIYNGEIYNYIEIKKELELKGHKFRTTSDTEVLLRGFIEWGPSVLNRCNGMWAFAIWDPRKQEIFMSRDRFGKKPFYYARHKGGFAFASEPKALHALEPGLKEPNISTVLNFIRESNLHAGEHTFYMHISALPAAHYAIFNVAKQEFLLHRYWDYPTEVADQEAHDYDDEFETLFDDAVKLRLRADVNVGLTLSGGLDSSSILASFSKQQNRKMKCYTSIFSDQARSEEVWARTAAKLGKTEVDSVTAPISDWLEILDRAIYHLDSPGTAPAVIPLWNIMKKARQDNTPVILEGQGADELLAGYPLYYAIKAVEQLKSGNLIQFAKDYGVMRESFTLKWSSAWLARKALPTLAQWYKVRQRSAIINPDIISCIQGDETKSTSGQSYDALRRSLWSDHAKDVLPNLLHYGDAISMAHGIESRLPFMDHRLVEWSFSKRPKLLNGNTKTPVRNYLHRQKFDAIAERKDKQGYPTPMLDWFKQFGRNHLDQILSETSAEVWNITNRKGVSRLADQAESGSFLAIFHLYKVVTLDLWLRQLKSR